jgi:predicted nucleotidyltransferase
MASPPPTLFGTIAERDYLQFWQAGRFQPQRVMRFIGLSKAEAAALASISPSSVRFDHKAPRDLLDRLTEIAATCELVAQYFAGNAAKVAVWFKTPNPELGDFAPRDLIRMGQHEKLHRLVMRTLAEESQAPSVAAGTISPANVLIASHREAIAQLCQRYRVRRLTVFGSALRSDFDPQRSDIDLAVEFAHEAAASPARQYFDFKFALEQLLARRVDLVELEAMPDSRLRRIIERTQVPLYAEAA